MHYEKCPPLACFKDSRSFSLDNPMKVLASSRVKQNVCPSPHHWGIDHICLIEYHYMLWNWPCISKSLFLIKQHIYFIYNRSKMCCKKAAALRIFLWRSQLFGKWDAFCHLWKEAKEERGKKREREMRGTNILTDEKNKCFCCVHRAEVSHIANYDITVGVMAAAVAFVKWSTIPHANKHGNVSKSLHTMRTA